MDSIFKDDNGDDDKPKQKEIETGKKEEEVVFYREGVAYEKEREKEIKERIASRIPDEYFKKMKRKSTGRKPACLNCVLIFCVGFIVILLLVLVWGRKILENDILSRQPFAFEPVNISDEEKEELEKQLSKYEDAIKKSKETGEDREVDLVFTENQLNYILQEYEKSEPPGKKLYIRIYPDGSQTTVRISSQYGKKTYVNVQLYGAPKIEYYKFTMDVANIKFGKMKNAENFKEKVFNRINRELDQYPRKTKLPFRIKTMKIESSKIKITLTVTGSGSQKLKVGDQQNEN